MPKVAIFAGPSVYGLKDSLFDGFERCPPAACGDVYRAVSRGAEIIGLIDGYFENELSIWHKEILHALSNGVVVYGAASLGALRAAECAAFGMIGIGEIFESYDRGSRVADADVAVAHAPADLGFEPLTVAMVDVEATLADAERRGAIDQETAAAVLDAARRVHFSQRNWLNVLEPLGAKIPDAPGLAGVLDDHHRSVKTSDAHLLLEEIRRRMGQSPPAPVGGWTFSRTGFFARFERSAAWTGS